MNNKLISMILGATVAIILVAAVLVPIITDASEDQHEYYNNSIGQYSKVVDEPVVIEYAYDSDNDTVSYTVNGVDQTLRFNYNDMIFSTSHASFKVTYANAPTFSSYILWLDETQGSRRIDTPTAVSAEIDADSISATIVKAGGDTESFEVGIDWGFYAVTEGDYRAVWNDPYNVYINDVNQVYSVNWLTTTNEFFSIHGESVVYGGGDATVSYDLTPVSGVIDVYNFMSGDFILTVDNNGTPYEATPFNVIVPAEIVGDKNNASDTIENLLWAIPLVVIVAILLVLVPVFRRD